MDLLGFVHTSHWSEDIGFRRVQAEQVQEEDMVKDSSMKETQKPKTLTLNRKSRRVCIVMQAGIEEKNGVFKSIYCRKWFSHKNGGTARF